MELWYIELEGSYAHKWIAEWDYYSSTDSEPNYLYTEWKNFNTAYLHFYYHKPLLF